MQLPPILSNEAERLAALRRYDILDTPAEPEFDDFTRLAAQICGTPVALITLIDTERQWFKSKVGVPMSETPREMAFCTHTIQGRDLLEISNLSEDIRFHDHPLVANNPSARFYAGAPLITPDGMGLGTLCVLDVVPRHLTPEQRDAIQTLSRQVMAQLELRRFNQHLKLVVEERTAALLEGEERFRQLAEFSSDVFWFVGLQPARSLFISPAVEKVWGWPAENFPQDAPVWQTAIHADDRSRVQKLWQACLLSQTPGFEAEYRIVRPDGSMRWVLDNGTPIRNASGEIIRLGGMAKDITESKQVETHRLRTQRLESIGTLAGGIAHDLNNALAPILMVTSLLRMQYPNGTELIDTVESSAKHGADMVRQLLTFAKGVEGARLSIQPLHLLREMEKIVKGTFPKNIQLRTDFGKNLHVLLGDSTQLYQVLLNLCVNARDAMPEGGTLTLAAENTEIDAASARAIPEGRPGRYVVWRVTDTGTGIPPEIIERIFEPFFSTKATDKGTGLGLSTVIGIVKSHGGFVQVISALGRGSTFAIYLPFAETGATATLSPFKAATDFRGHGETILVVDDEAAVRQTARSVLTSLNFAVLTARNGTEGLIQAAELQSGLYAVMTDQHMPEMDGLTFVRSLKGILPQIGIIVVSGRMDEREASEFKTLGVDAMLDKPFTQEKLVEALKTVFKKRRPNAKVPALSSTQF